MWTPFRTLQVLLVVVRCCLLWTLLHWVPSGFHDYASGRGIIMVLATFLPPAALATILSIWLWGCSHATKRSQLFHQLNIWFCRAFTAVIFGFGVLSISQFVEIDTAPVWNHRSKTCSTLIFIISIMEFGAVLFYLAYQLGKLSTKAAADAVAVKDDSIEIYPHLDPKEAKRVISVLHIAKFFPVMGFFFLVALLAYDNSSPAAVDFVLETPTDRSEPQEYPSRIRGVDWRQWRRRCYFVRTKHQLGALTDFALHILLHALTEHKRYEMRQWTSIAKRAFVLASVISLMHHLYAVIEETNNTRSPIGIVLSISNLAWIVAIQVGGVGYVCAHQHILPNLFWRNKQKNIQERDPDSKVGLWVNIHGCPKCGSVNLNRHVKDD